MNQLIDNFRHYLTDTKQVSQSTVKNYLSDLRHFLFWYTSCFPSKPFEVKKIDFTLLSNYKSHLLSQETAKSTTNRRLATLRVFCQYCHNSGLLEHSPASKLTNLPVTSSQEKKISDLVSRFGHWLKENHSSHNTIKNYTADVRQFLEKKKKN